MKEIGGYFEVEYSNIEVGIHNNAIKLVSGRQCLEYILVTRKYSKVYLPYYLCDVILNQLSAHNVAYEYYNINADMEIISMPELTDGEALLYINYWGIKNDYVCALSRKTSQLIIDNSQALFAAPVPGIDTFYSLRKFVGAADGGLLYCSHNPGIILEESDSSHRITHLYARKNKDAAAGYVAFLEGEKEFMTLKMCKMPRSTESFIKTYDFEKNKAIRDRNFLFLHYHLGAINNLKIDALATCGPISYPFVCTDKKLKQVLIDNKIYVATNWHNIIDSEVSSFEYHLSFHILPLPIDHRYEITDLVRIIDIIKEFYAN